VTWTFGQSAHSVPVPYENARALTLLISAAEQGIAFELRMGPW
jgi:hypothetical protein